MRQTTPTIGRTVRRVSVLTISLLGAATGTAAAHGGGSYDGSTMDGGWGLFHGAMGLWGFLWMGLLIAVPLSIVYLLLRRESGENEKRSLSVLRERYARGDLSDDEFERRRDRLERAG